MKKPVVYSLLCGLLFACAETVPAADPSLPDMYAAAHQKIDEKSYAEGAALFGEVETTFPTNPWAADALIMAAYGQYQARDFAGAIITIDRFMRFHPGHPHADYVLYLKGMCFYRQVSDVRREPGMSGYALGAFTQLVQRFPKSEYAKNAENKITILKNYIAGKMMYSARRDLARQNWTVAITNLQTIVTKMQETQMTPEALFRLTEAYTAIGLSEQAAGYAEMLRINFPDNEWTKKL